MAWRPSHLSQHNLSPSLLLLMLLLCSTDSVTDFDDDARFAAEEEAAAAADDDALDGSTALFLELKDTTLRKCCRVDWGIVCEVPVLFCAEWPADESIELDAAVRETQQPISRRTRWSSSRRTFVSAMP